MAQWYPKIRNAFEDLMHECNTDPPACFQPILEDDFLGRIYYHFLVKNTNARYKIYLKTRILSDPKRKYDLVIGNKTPEEPTKKDRVYVKPELIAEFKIYPHGFTSAQLSKRRKGALEDIEKLGNLEIIGEKVICLFDQRGWLRGRNKNSYSLRIEEIFI
jgi:hypothetical protein